MATALRKSKTFSFEREVLREVERTRGSLSTSERVNELLKLGLEQQRKRSLHAEAAAFFGERESKEEAAETEAFGSAAREVWSRESD